MKKFTNTEAAIVNLANLAMGLDKETFAKRLRISMNAVYNAIDAMQDVAERLQALAALECLKDAKNGVFSIPCWFDENSSMFIIQGCITRDVKSLKYVGVSQKAPQRTYKKLEEAWRVDCAEVGVKTDKVDDFKHNAAIPYGYCGEGCVKGALGKAGYEVFQSTFKKALPKCAEFREACLDAWNETAYSYVWELPDGFQVEVPVLGDKHKEDIHVGNMTIGYYLQENEPRPKYVKNEFAREGQPDYKRNIDTRSMGANVTHSLDRYVLMEIVRRCDMTRARALDILNKCQKQKEGLSENHPQLARLHTCYIDMGICSSRWFYLLENNPVKLPEYLEKDLRKLAETLSKNEHGFPVMVIHDAFGVTANHVNYLRRTANQVFADLYKGRYMHYLNKKLGIACSVDEYDEAVYEAILDSDYLVH